MNKATEDHHKRTAKNLLTDIKRCLLLNDEPLAFDMLTAHLEQAYIKGKIEAVENLRAKKNE